MRVVQDFTVTFAREGIAFKEEENRRTQIRPRTALSRCGGQSRVYFWQDSETLNPPRIFTRVLSGIPLFEHPFIGDSSVGQSQSEYARHTYDLRSAPKHACAAPSLPLVRA